MYRRHICIACTLLLTLTSACQADIFRWDNGQLIPGTEGITPGPGVQLSNRDLEFADLSDKNLVNSRFDLSRLSSANFGHSNLFSATFTSADLKDANLTDAQLQSTRFDNADLTDANLSNARLASATLANTNMAGAVVTGTEFSGTTSKGFTKEQLYDTASYQAGNLQRIGLRNNQLPGWDFRGQDLSEADFDGATLTNADLTGAIINGANFAFTSASGFRKEQLYATASYQAKDLRAIALSANNLSGWDFKGQDLTDASFSNATLTNADLTGAIINGADFAFTSTSGFTKEQLYSTANYQTKNLKGIGLAYNDLTGWDFTGQYISGADFGGTTRQGGFTKEQLYATASYQAKDLEAVGLADNYLSGWDFTGQNFQRADFSHSAMNGANLARADLRGATYFRCFDTGCIDIWALALRTATVANTILADGTVPGLELATGERLIVRDDDGGPNALSRFEYPDLSPSEWPPIQVTIKDHMAMVGDSRLALFFDADPWDSLISFEPGIPVQLGGQLELAFADDVEVASQVGRTLRIFDWTGVSPMGLFEIRSLYVWDRANLYTTGEVTLLAVPEPATLVLGGTALLSPFVWRTNKGARRIRVPRTNKGARNRFAIWLLTPFLLLQFALCNKDYSASWQASHSRRTFAR
jgi:uncharacterized protein YjbI with pentapeptide repeats